MEGDQLKDSDLSNSTSLAAPTSRPSEYVLTQTYQLRLFEMSLQASGRQSGSASSGRYFTPDSSSFSIAGPTDWSLQPLAGDQLPERSPLQWSAEGLCDSVNDDLQIFSITDRAVRTFWGQHFCTHPLLRGQEESASQIHEKDRTGKRRADSELERLNTTKRRVIQNRLAQKAFIERK